MAGGSDGSDVPPDARPAFPDVVTHYYRAARPPFLNLSDLDGDHLREVVLTLERERVAGLSARVFGPRYMELRRRTEDKLRSLFADGGGTPERRAPHYFVLGSSPWYEGLAPDMRSVVLDLTDLPPALTSITYPDSFTAMGLGPDYGLPHEPRPYHERVYRLEELPDLVATHGLPADTVPAADAGNGPHRYTGYQHRSFEMYIEIQLWSDEPLRRCRPAS